MFALKFIFKEIYWLLKSPLSFKFILLMFKLGGKKRYTSLSITFNKWNIQIIDSMSFIFQVKEIFLDESYFFKTTKKNPIIYDCGSNIGVSCLYYKFKYPEAQVTAFEADPKIAEVLAKNLKNNNIQNVNVFNKAIWINNDGVELQTDGADGATIVDNTKGSTVFVQSIRLLDILKKEEVIDFLKIDIEGVEVQVLKDCGEELKKVKSLFVEYHSITGQSQELNVLLEVLSNNGFRYYIKEVDNRIKPFTMDMAANKMDMQLNISAYRIN